MKKIICIATILFLLISSTVLVYGDNDKKENYGKNLGQIMKELKGQMKYHYKNKSKVEDILKQMSSVKKQQGDNNVYAFVNGEEFTCNFPQNIAENKMASTLKSFLNTIGVESKWNESEKTLTIFGYGAKLVIRPGRNTITINGVETRMDAWSDVANTRTVYLLSKISQVYGHEVKMDLQSGIVLVTLRDISKYNVALKQKAQASSTESNWRKESYAVDGSMKTRWDSKNYNTAWITVEFGGYKTICAARLRWESAYAKAYKLQISNDGKTWADVFTTSIGDGGDDWILFQSITTKFVRVLCEKRSRNSGYSLWELEVYNTDGLLGQLQIQTPTPTPLLTPVPTPTPTPTPISTPSPTYSAKIEAENSVLSWGASVEKNHKGFSGDGFVNGYWNLGAQTLFNVYVQQAGSYNIVLRYANATGINRTLSIYVNGVKIRQTVLPALNNWDTWDDKSEMLSLNAGNNTIAYRFDSGDSGYVNLDFIKMSIIQGVLSGSLAVSPRTVTLSGEGNLDWVHWGLGDASGFNRKSNTAQLISNFTRIGGSFTGWLADSYTNFSWQGGAPTASAQNITSSVYATQAGYGFQFVVPADTTQKTLKIYVGAWKAKGKLEVYLSDGTIIPYTEFLDAPNGSASGVFTIQYRSILPGHVLTIKYFIDTAYDSVLGNVSLQAVTIK